jgi:hypothetical protein
MAFLDREQLDTLAIERMVFHVVGPDESELILLEEIEPGSFSEFFLDRLKGANSGIIFDFLGASAVLTSIHLIEADPQSFVPESKKLAALFKAQHTGAAVKGVFFLFMLRSAQDRFYALLKYDHQAVLSYRIEDRATGHYPLLQQMQDTFVKSPEALQKSAIVRLTENGGELCVKDRIAPKEITHYFRGFLGAQRRHTSATLTEKLAEITQRVAKEHSSELSDDARKNLRQRLYETVQTQDGFDPENRDAFLTAVFGPLSEESKIRQAFDRKLRSASLEGEAFEFDRVALPRPSKRRIVTTEGIQVIWDREYEENVRLQALAGGRTQITITTGGVRENDDFSESNTRRR